MSAAVNPATESENGARIAGERRSQRLVTAFVMSGLVFMLLPGTFLGVWNLLDISQGHGPEAVPQAWLQAHGQAQIFGWIGSFILGIGFYSLTKMNGTKAFPARAGWVAWGLWTTGVFMRWIGGVTDDGWRALLPISAALQLAGFFAFYMSVRRHRPAGTGTKDKAWMRLVACASLAFLVALAVNGWLLLEQATRGNSPALPHLADQQFIVLALWGVLVPTIWGFNAHWLPVFLGLRAPNPKTLYAAYVFSVTGVIATFLQLLPFAEVAFLLGARACNDRRSLGFLRRYMGSQPSCDHRWIRSRHGIRHRAAGSAGLLRNAHTLQHSPHGLVTLPAFRGMPVARDSRAVGV
jgi:uncharacterized protein involved in response to NO